MRSIVRVKHTFYIEPEFEIQIWIFLNRQDKRENEGVLVAASLCDINAMLMYSNGLCSACRAIALVRG